MRFLELSLNLAVEQLHDLAQILLDLFTLLPLDVSTVTLFVLNALFAIHLLVYVVLCLVSLSEIFVHLFPHLCHYPRHFCHVESRKVFTH